MEVVEGRLGLVVGRGDKAWLAWERSIKTIGYNGKVLGPFGFFEIARMMVEVGSRWYRLPGSMICVDGGRKEAKEFVCWCMCMNVPLKNIVLF